MLEITFEHEFFREREFTDLSLVVQDFYSLNAITQQLIKDRVGNTGNEIEEVW